MFSNRRLTWPRTGRKRQRTDVCEKPLPYVPLASEGSERERILKINNNNKNEGTKYIMYLKMQ